MNNNQQNFNTNNPQDWQQQQQQQMYQQQWSQYGYGYNQCQQPQTFQYQQNFTQPPPPPPSQPPQSSTNIQQSSSNNSTPQNDRRTQQNYQGGNNWNSGGNQRNNQQNQQNWMRGKAGGSRGAGNSNRGGGRGNFNDGNRNYNDNKGSATGRSNERYGDQREQPQSSHQMDDRSQPSASSDLDQKQMDAEDAAFMKHFESWELEFQKWRNENKNHPDREQYAKYENQFLEVRTKLLERRNEMMRRRQLANPQKTAEQRKFESQWMAGDAETTKTFYEPPPVSGNQITVQVPPSSSSMGDTAVAALLFGSSMTQDKDFRNDSFDNDTFDSFNEDSSNSGFRDRVFNRNASIPGLDMPPPNFDDDKITEVDMEVIDLDNNDDNAMPPPTPTQTQQPPPVEEKKFELVLPNFKSKIERPVKDIDDLIEEPGRSARAEKNLIIIRGASGSGKSYLAGLIQKKEFEYGNDRVQIVEAHKRQFNAVLNELQDIIREGYINLTLLVMTNATVSQMSIITGTCFKRGFVQSFSIELHQTLESCMKNNVNNAPISEIRSGIESLEQNPTPLRTPILDATSLFNPKPKVDLASLTNLLKDQNVMNLVSALKMTSNAPSSASPKNTNFPQNFSNQPTFSNQQNFNNNQQNFNNSPQNFNNNQQNFNVPRNFLQPPPVIEDPVFESKKVIEYNHEHLPTFEEHLMGFKIFQIIDYKHQTKQELQDLKRTVDVDKIIDKRKAVAQRKKILEYLRNAQRPEDTVSNPLYPKNWELIPRERPPRRNKRKKVITHKIRRILIAQQNESQDKNSRNTRMDLEEISSDEDVEMQSPPKFFKKSEPKNDKPLLRFEREEKVVELPVVIFKDEFAHVTPKSIPDFNHFNHRNCMDIREILWQPARKNRSPKILIILRGAAGSGKSHLVQLIKRKESEAGKASDIRILSIDDYYLTDDDDDEKSFSQEKISNYLEEMLKHLKKTITDGHHPFIIIDAENCDLLYYDKFCLLGSSMGFAVFAIELYQTPEICMQQCCRNVSADQINESIRFLNQKRIPSYNTLLIPTALYAEYKCFVNPKLASSQSDVVQEEISDKVPTFNWHNQRTKDLCELLEGQSRFQRAPCIALLLRGPDTYGKAQLASMIIAREKEMRNSNVTFISVEDFFVSKSSGKFEFSSRLIEESMRNLTRQLRDITRTKSFKLIIINVETGDFNHYTQVHELMSSYGYKCYTLECYKDAEKCAEKDPHKRGKEQFVSIIDEFKLNPTPPGHELLNGARFYNKNMPKEVFKEASTSIFDSQPEAAPKDVPLTIKKVKKFDKYLRSFDTLQDEFNALLSQRIKVNGDFVVKNPSPPSKLPEFNWYNQELVDIRELFEGADKCPPKVAIFIRGAPGSGKSFLARLIERKELENESRENVTILSVDKYFEKDSYQEVAAEKYEKFIECNLDESKIGDYMEELSHELENLVNYDESNKSLIIIDGDFCELNYYQRMWSIAVNEGGFAGYTIELNQDDDICLKYNYHRWSEDSILNKNNQMREVQTPSDHQLLDPEYLYAEYKYELKPEGDIFTVNVHADEISDGDSDSDDTTTKPAASKWDTAENDKYERMDGTKNKILHHTTMEDYLQTDEWTMRPSTSGKKRVRWADIEAKKKQERDRQLGFIVGQSDWNTLMNETDGKSELEKTKYIEPRRKK